MRGPVERPAFDDEAAGRNRPAAARSSWPRRPRRRAAPRAVPRRRASTRPTVAVFANRSPLSDMRIVRTRCGSKPGSTARSAMKVRMNSAAPTSSTSASPISLTTSNARALFCRKPLPDRPLLSLMVVLRSTRAARSAGNRPKTQPGQQRHHGREGQHAPVDADGRTVDADPRDVARVERERARGCRPCRAPGRARRPAATAPRSR